MATIKEKMDYNYYEKKIQEIRKVLNKTVYPPVFEPDFWENCQVNCYAYALNINVEDNKKMIWYPGCISDKNNKQEIKSSITIPLQKDLDFIGLKYRINEWTLKPDEYRIAIYRFLSENKIGFHIVRQDKDGKWSEKRSWNSPISIHSINNSPPDLSLYGYSLENVLIISKK